MRLPVTVAGSRVAVPAGCRRAECGSALTAKGSAFSVYHVHRNFVWTYVRYMPGRLFWLYLAAHVGANVASIAVFVRKGQSGAILRAKWHAQRGLPRTLCERRRIQRQRKITPSDLLPALERGNLFVWAYWSARRVLGLR